MATITRDDYLKGTVDHHTYYLAVADAIGRSGLENIVRRIATPEELKAKLAQDSHLNNIPLHLWDGWDMAIRMSVSHKASAVMAITWNESPNRVPLKPHTYCWSLSDTVCVLKAVAVQMVKDREVSA